MSKNSRALFLLAVAAGCSLPAMGQTIYRCGDSYSQQPCPGGKPVAVDDARTPAQRAQTTEAVRRQAAVADQMERDRLKEEAKPASVAMPPAKVDDPQDRRKRTDAAAQEVKPKHFSAVSPKKSGDPAPKKKKKAKKAKAKTNAD